MSPADLPTFCLALAFTAVAMEGGKPPTARGIVRAAALRKLYGGVLRHVRAGRFRRNRRGYASR
jgi:hypothetical protein